MRVAPAVVLSPEEATRLRRWASARAGADPERARRASVVLLAAEGRQDLEIAAAVGLHRLTVARWRRRFLARRLRGLLGSAPSLRSGTIPADRVDAIVHPASGRQWSTRSLARAHGVSHATVHRLWKLHGVRSVRWDAVPSRADPTLPLVPWDVVGVSLQEAAAALAVTLHPLPAGESFPPPRAKNPLGPVPALPALRPLGIRTQDGGARRLLPFLGTLGTNLPPTTPAHVVLTPGPDGIERTLRAWKLRHPNVHVEFVADGAAWQRRSGELVRAAGRSARSDDPVRGPAEAGGSLGRYLAGYRAAGGPYEWVATRREITAGEAVYRLRYDLAVTGHPGFKAPGPLVASMPRSEGPEASARAMARTIVRKYLRVRRAERVTIETWTATVPEANAMVLETLRVGARPMLVYQDEPTYWAAAAEVSGKDLSHLGAQQKAALAETDVLVSFFGPSDRERYHALPPALRDQLCKAEDEFYRAVARSGARAVSLALGRVSPASARMYGVDAAAWRQELVAASLVDPKKLAERGKRVAARLARGRELELRHANGTRLRLRLHGAEPVVADGSVRPARKSDEFDLVTLPAGVVMVALDDTVAEGTFRSNQGSWAGTSGPVGEMEGGQWTFENGRLSRFRYAVGEEVFRQSYDRAPAGRDRPGSLSIGLNEKIHRAVLLEDQGLGTVTMHLGRNEHLGGRNRVPWWAWLFQRGGDVLVDGRPLVRGGTIVA